MCAMKMRIYIDSCKIPPNDGGSETRVRLYVHRNERNPLTVAEQKVIIPNERRAPCSHELKILQFRRYIAQLPKPLTIMLGMDWKEQHRLEAPRKAYEALGYQVDYPLMWKPWELRPYQDVIREEWGIEPPRLYAMGFPHNNCGGRCIKQGVKEWLRLRYHFPKRFEAMKQGELAQRAKGGARATHAICSEERNKVRSPLTLEEIERRRPRGALRAADAGDHQRQRIQGRSRAVLLCLCVVYSVHAMSV
jgi:hypothetical protein